MRQVTLVRLNTDPNHGTFGVLLIDGETFCVTLEPYKRDNQVGVSSIPTGQYICERYSSQKYPNTFEITGVAGRTKVLFHKGNVDRATRGCVLLGQYFGKLKSERAVLNSGATFGAFLVALKNESKFMLTIKECF